MKTPWQAPHVRTLSSCLYHYVSVMQMVPATLALHKMARVSQAAVACDAVFPSQSPGSVEKLKHCLTSTSVLAQGGKVDKFMSYTQPGLRGAPVHEYRDAAAATNKHYDTGHKAPHHVHMNRFLLKAQPQQGKTGTTADMPSDCTFCKLLFKTCDRS